MKVLEIAPASAAQLDRTEALVPERFGFRPYREGWLAELGELGTVAFAPLTWAHAQLSTYADIGNQRVRMDALTFVVELQRHVWGMPPEDLVPNNFLAIIPDTSGAVLVAYRLDRGFNADGWLGFVFGAGGRTGTFVSHMLGVREEVRGAHDVGWRLKLIQGHLALRGGHTAMTWTFDPMRGANARLNLEKLGAEVREFTIDKYGLLRSTLYGDVPSDRFTATWDLCAAATHDRLHAVHAGAYRALTLANVADLPILTQETHAALAATRPPRLRVEIPGDVDRLMRVDPAAAILWRQRLRDALGGFVLTKRARLDGADADGPIAVGIETLPGDYAIRGFATGEVAPGERLNWYVLERTAP